ncbi:hypothetical protein AAG906_032960 [Vitis piasezkii]
MWHAPLWPQRHKAWYGLPSLRIGTRTPKYLCSEPVGEDMGAMPWFNWALDMQFCILVEIGIIQVGKGDPIIVVAHYIAFIRVEKKDWLRKVQWKPCKKGLLRWKKCWENGHMRMTLWLHGQSTLWGKSKCRGSYGKDIAILKKVVLHGCSSSNEAPPKVRVPEPKIFNGNRNMKELENFLWDMEQFFRVAHVLDSEKVSITSMYLTGDAKLWWRTRIEDDVEFGRPQIITLETLKNELKDQFLPTNTSWVAKESLKRLRHTESVRKYVKEFSSLMLHIKNMSKNDKFFNFMFGLQGWAAELGDKDSCLMDYKMGGTISTMRNQSRRRQKAKVESKTSKKSGWKKQNKKGGAGVKPMKKTTKFVQHSTWMTGCFIYNGPYQARDYSKREKLSVLVVVDDKGKSDSETPLRVNPLQLLNVIHGETLIQKSLMHVHAIVNGV